MFGSRVREGRTALGLTQAQLAARAGVSRQLVGAVEAGRHLPRVDAAVALARVLGVEVEALLGSAPSSGSAPVAVVGDLPPVGAPVGVGVVDDRLVCVPVTPGAGWADAAGVVTPDGVALLQGARPAAVVVGCDPALGLAARLSTGRGGQAVIAVAASSAAAVDALDGGRAHAAVVHGPVGHLARPSTAARGWWLTSWRVGLAAPADTAGAWWQDVLAGRRPVIQREQGAGAQAALHRAVDAAGGHLPPGRQADSHAEAAWLARLEGTTALTIEPVARSQGMAFHPLEEHHAVLWLVEEHGHVDGLARFQEVVRSAAFRRRLDAVGGYDLSRSGEEVAA